MNARIRQLHRWLSALFTAAVMLNFGAMAVGSDAMWVGFVALIPLIPLLMTGIYLLVLPWLPART